MQNLDKNFQAEKFIEALIEYSNFYDEFKNI